MRRESRIGIVTVLMSCVVSIYEDTDILSALISLRPATTVLRPCLYLHRKTCSVLFPGFIWVPAHTEGGKNVPESESPQTVIDVTDHINHFRISTNANTEFYFTHNAYQSSVPRALQALTLKEKQTFS